MKKQQNGITLIALVITIIILLILAGVALSIVFNGGIIEKSQNAVDSYNYSSVNEDEKLSDLEEKFQQLYDERVVAKEEDNSGAEWIIDIDYGDTGLSLGDLIKPKNLKGEYSYLANEKFYVIGIDGEGDTQTVRLLAEKNVKTNDEISKNNIQSPSANFISFGSSSVYYTNANSQSSIKGKVDEYVGKLISAGLTLQEVETSEGGTAEGSGVYGRLMWGTTTSGTEVQNVLAINASGTNSITGSVIVKGTNDNKMQYWLGTPYWGYGKTLPWCWNVGVYGGYVEIKSQRADIGSFRSTPSYKSFII